MKKYRISFIKIIKGNPKAIHRYCDGLEKFLSELMAINSDKNVDIESIDISTI